MAVAGVVRSLYVCHRFFYSKNLLDNLLLQKNVTKNLKILSASKWYQIHMCYCTKIRDAITGKEVPDPDAPAPKKHKPLTSPEINLIHQNGRVERVTLEQAQKLSKRRQLKLVKILDFDTKSERPVYKLMSNLEYLEEEKRTKSKKANQKNLAFKEEKLFSFSTNSGEHDIEIKIRQATKLLKKKHLVRIVVTHDNNPDKVKHIKTLIEEHIVDVAKIQNSGQSNTATKFFIHPIIKEELVESDNSKEKQNSTSLDDNKAAANNP